MEIIKVRTFRELRANLPKFLRLVRGGDILDFDGTEIGWIDQGAGKELRRDGENFEGV